MDSEQLLHHYVSDSLLTTLVPFHEFKQLLRPHTSDEQQLRRWYGLLEDRDAQAVAALQDRIKQFFVGLRSRLLRVLETDQQAHSRQPRDADRYSLQDQRRVAAAPTSPGQRHPRKHSGAGAIRRNSPIIGS